MDEPTPPRCSRRLFRFSLFSLLLAMTCLAGYLAGYRWGGKQHDQDAHDVSFFAKAYYVADLVTPVPGADGGADFDPLIELITSTIGSETWKENGGGEGEVHPYPANLSLVVSNTGAVHDEIERCLQQLRDLRYKLPEGYLVAVRERLNRKSSTPYLIKVYQVIDPVYHQELENFFATALDDLTSEHGRPDLVATAGDKAFPAWAAARKIAVWNRGRGKLYLALQDCLPRGEALVAGWWEESFGEMSPVQIAPPAVASAD